jgi:hypothetical protein
MNRGGTGWLPVTAASTIALRIPFAVGRSHISLTRQKSNLIQWIARSRLWFSHIDSLPTDSGPNSSSLLRSVLVHGVDPEFSCYPSPR